MPLSSLVLVDDESASTTFTLVGQTDKGGVYRDASRALNAPNDVTIAYKVGNPGQTSNDHVSIKVRDVGINSQTNQTYTSSIAVDISIPRDGEAPALTAQNLMAQLSDLFGQAAWRDEIAAAQLPATAKV